MKTKKKLPFEFWIEEIRTEFWQEDYWQDCWLRWYFLGSYDSISENHKEWIRNLRNEQKGERLSR